MQFSQRRVDARASHYLQRLADTEIAEDSLPFA
jgi:hypothetical protein